MFDPKMFGASQSQLRSNSAEDGQSTKVLAEAGPVSDEKRRISIRFRIASGFLVCFFMALSITLLSLYVLIRLQTKLHFLEVADNLMLELQQARRFEKNFFLYGTNLGDAQDHVNTALKFLQVNAVQLEEVVGNKNLANILEQIRTYENLLHKLEDSVSAGLKGGPERTLLEGDLRKYGAEMLSSGLELVQQERQSVYRMLALAKQVPVYFLLCLFGVMALLAHKLSRQIINPLSRLMKFTQRIAQGEFTALKPVRHYRDEFFDLMQAMNFMLAELHHRQEILMQSHKLRALGTLTAGIAHELNNPINNITLTAYSLRDDYRTLSDHEKIDMIQELIDQADRTQGIISNLLDFSRESAARMEPLDMGQLIEETVRLAGKQIKMAGAYLNLNLGATARLYGDRQQLSQVLLNILINALDVIPRDGNIQLTLTQETPNVVAVKIHDNGPGIPEDILPHIFDPFFTTKPPGRGTGLGLAVSQGIIARHGGQILVESAPGQGATFTVMLPVTTI
jgi:two-component system, NtrC family, sensor kinase